MKWEIENFQKLIDRYNLFLYGGGQSAEFIETTKTRFEDFKKEGFKDKRYNVIKGIYQDAIDKIINILEDPSLFDKETLKFSLVRLNQFLGHCKELEF